MQKEDMDTLLKGKAVVKPKSWLFLLLLVTILLSACNANGGTGSGSDSSDGLGVISGSVAYRERIAMPANAVITIQLLDISQQGSRATVLAQQRIRPSREVPIPFTVQYDRSKIDRRGTYGIAATIEVDGEVIWRSDGSQLVITNGNPTENIEIVVTRLP